MKSLACRLATTTFLRVMLSPFSLNVISVSTPDAAAWAPSQVPIVELSTANENARRSIWSSPALKSVIVSALGLVSGAKDELVGTHAAG